MSMGRKYIKSGDQTWPTDLIYVQRKESHGCISAVNIGVIKSVKEVNLSNDIRKLFEDGFVFDSMEDIFDTANNLATTENPKSCVL